MQTKQIFAKVNKNHNIKSLMMYFYRTFVIGIEDKTLLLKHCFYKSDIIISPWNLSNNIIYSGSFRFLRFIYESKVFRHDVFVM